MNKPKFKLGGRVALEHCDYRTTRIDTCMFAMNTIHLLSQSVSAYIALCSSPLPTKSFPPKDVMVHTGIHI